MANLATTGTNCFPEPADININEYTLSLGGATVQFRRDSFAPAAAVGFLTLTVAPVSETALQLYKNGVLLTYTTDYTRSGTTITLAFAAVAGDKFEAIYLAAS